MKSLKDWGNSDIGLVRFVCMYTKWKMYYCNIRHDYFVKHNQLNSIFIAAYVIDIFCAKCHWKLSNNVRNDLKRATCLHEMLMIFSKQTQTITEQSVLKNPYNKRNRKYGPYKTLFFLFLGPISIRTLRIISI